MAHYVTIGRIHVSCRRHIAARVSVALEETLRDSFLNDLFHGSNLNLDVWLRAVKSYDPTPLLDMVLRGRRTTIRN